MKKYIVLAGVNGAGKTTFYSSGVALFDNIERINVDDVVRELGDWHNPYDVLKAGKIIVSRINSCFENESSFCQETTLCGKSIMKNILRAKDFGYEIDMYYVGLNDVELAKKRVHYRVEHGGHGISDEDIERRYYESLDNLKKTIPLCDKVFIYDNSVFFRWIAMYRNGQREWASKDKPVWIEDLEDYFTKGKNE